MSSKEASGKGLIVIFSAPSGCGKTSIVDRLLKRHPDWVRSISATTRPPRSDEKEGEDYFFLPVKEFQEREAEGLFLESASVHGNFYGTPADYVLKHYGDGRVVVLAIDVQGMEKVQKKLNDRVPVLSIFILPPSLKILRQRLEGRKTESVEEIEGRLHIAEEEIKKADMYDRTVVNQNLEQAVLEIDEMINSFLHEREKQEKRG